MQSKLTLALLASTLAVGSLAAPQAAGATTVDGIVVPSSVISEVYADVTSILAQVPSSVLAAVATISGLPTDQAGILSAVSEFEAGATPAWFSALQEVVPTSVQTSILGAAESAIEQFTGVLSEISTATEGASTLTTTTPLVAPTLPPTIGTNGTAPYANGTVTTPQPSGTAKPSGTTTGLPAASQTNGAAGLNMVGVASLMALSGVLGLAALL